MATINAKTFPGAYVQITDKSFLPTTTSRFKPGLIGVASKGPFDTPTAIHSLQEFVKVFGSPISSGDGYLAKGVPIASDVGYLAEAVGILADLTDGITVVRVGNQYKSMPLATAWGTKSSTKVITSGTNAYFIDWIKSKTGQAYVALSDPGKASSVNLSVLSSSVGADGNGTIAVDTALSDTYTDATIRYNENADAAWKAESIIYGYGYADISNQVGNISGVKGQYAFNIQSGSETFNDGLNDLYAITDKDLQSQPTYEFRVSKIAGNTIYMSSTDNTEIGYQAVPLQDSYTNGRLWKVVAKTPFLLVSALTAGDWANGAAPSAGLYVAVHPGSKAGTKCLEVYWNNALVETFDNLSANPVSADYYSTRINNNSDYISIDLANNNEKNGLSLDSAGTHAANTVNPWNSAYIAEDSGAMPFGAINAGWLYKSLSSTPEKTGGQFVSGVNGENADTTDFVGQIQDDDTVTGLKCFEDKDTVSVNVLAAPKDQIAVGIMQELRRVAKKINALAIADVPAGLNIWKAIDWHNGAGAYRANGRIDDPNIAVFWNWFQITSPFNGLTKMVPPTLAALRCMASTWQRENPWSAAAGEVRGAIPEALAVEFDRISEDAKQAMYGNGNSINPIWKTNGRFLLWGDRTLQRTESKLTAIHSVNLVNWIVASLGAVSRKHTFDPNDATLIDTLDLEFSEILDKIQNSHGLEKYDLAINDKNNTAETRNRKEVNVDLAIIPIDVMERLNLNVTVRESGATLNSVS